MNFSHSSTPVTPIAPRTIPDISNTTKEDVEKILSEYRQNLMQKTQHHMGYPYNLSYNCKELQDLVEYSINNLGDPFIESNYGVHSRIFEISVLDWFANLWEINKEDYWGYITCCGTEGNLHGIYLGRESYPEGILYASEDSHYSVFKAARMYRMDSEKIKSNQNGTINLDHLKQQLLSNIGRAAIINVNIGTTLKGGVDDLDGVIETLIECGYSEDQFYIHCDGALVGIMISFLQDRYISFSRKPIGSVSVSGHKFIGSPIPCGVIITRMKYMLALAENIDYINSRDATIMGSRNGHAPLYLWYNLVQKGTEGIKKDVFNCIDKAKYLENKLREKGVEEVMLNKWSNTVVFKAPFDQEIITKWQLACSNSLCHIVVMPNIDIEKLDSFIIEYCSASNNFNNNNTNNDNDNDNK